jgi:hypothetical protein
MTSNIAEKNEKNCLLWGKELDSISPATYSLTTETGELFSYLQSPISKK